ncbi:hypothetical protein MVEG_10898 [Podila verticillata NRRL 6337]|nr:hypothetical protein MVEG_10898 [Podila verticillata NRRL 6337]
MGKVGNSEQAIGGLKACFKKVGRRGLRVKDSVDASSVSNLDAFHAEELYDQTLDRIPSTFGSIANKTQMSEFLDQVLEERTVRKVLQLREMVNGPTFVLMLKTSLSQINSAPNVFNLDTWQESLAGHVQKEAIACGTGMYHRVLNAHLDRHPLPVTWHNLMIMHQDAQRQALEEIERRYYTNEYNLPMLLKTFRSHCLETRAAENRSLLFDAPITEGLYSEYYMANAHELQMHHMAILDEHWQQYVKCRLTHRMTSLPATLSPPAIPTRPSTSLPDIKNLSEFLAAVDSVRKNYLQICIPSPEAIAVLESLEEMQQAEIIFFSQGTSTKPLPPQGSYVPLVSSLSVPSISGQGQYDTHSVSLLIEGRDGTFARTDDFRSILGARRNSTQHEPSTTLEYQISEILQAKRKDGDSKIDVPLSALEQGSSLKQKKESGCARAVQFGWTLHMLHANTLQYAWMWSWFNNHSGSSGQNVVACDSKVYTASKWILLPAKDTVRTRKDWKVSYGDRVWLTSYWFSTRNAKMELPEYLPLARGAPCRHIIPYGETYIICKTCPADVLCMRCFRASDHTDHTMYLQCSWGTSVCLCNDKRHSPNHPHCSIHSAEMEPSYSHLAKGKLCTAKLKSDETIYICKSCTDGGTTLCARCFRSVRIPGICIS